MYFGTVLAQKCLFKVVYVFAFPFYNWTFYLLWIEQISYLWSCLTKRENPACLCVKLNVVLCCSPILISELLQNPSFYLIIYLLALQIRTGVAKKETKTIFEITFKIQRPPIREGVKINLFLPASTGRLTRVMLSLVGWYFMLFHMYTWPWFNSNNKAPK